MVKQGVPSEFWWLGPALVRTPEMRAEVCSVIGEESFDLPSP
jgi:hypothetical protein